MSPNSAEQTFSSFDPLSLNHRTRDEYYVFLLYVVCKVGPNFDIFVNGQKVKVVSEDFSLLNNRSGSLHFIIVDPTKKKKRKLGSEGFLKQNGDENRLHVHNRDFIPSKRNFTRIRYVDNDKSFKCWEYSLTLDGVNHFPVILRHYLNDLSQQIKYFTNIINISLKSKTRYFSMNVCNIHVGDYDLIDSIHYFSETHNIIKPNQCVEIDDDIKSFNLNENYSNNNNNNNNDIFQQFQQNKKIKIN